MTRMLPPRIPDTAKSNAERRVFHMMEDGLSGEWTALYSVCLSSHSYKPWAEVDFVLIGSPGIFCLEVKGGRVARENGMWEFTDREDKVNKKAEGPFEQVGTASSALRRYLVARWPHLSGAVVGHGVIMPDIVFGVRGPEIEPEVVYDMRDAARPFSAYIRRLVDYWNGRIAGVRRSEPEALSEHDRHAVVDLLRGDFDFRPALRSQVADTKEQLSNLTAEQYKVLDGLADNPRVIIQGGAGTGKTWLALLEAVSRADQGEVLLTCFNKNLASFLAGKLHNNQRIRIQHFHGLMVDLVKRADLERELPKVQEEDLFTVYYPTLAIEALPKLGLLQAYDTLIVDEAQDLLLETYVEVFDALLKGGLSKGRWRFFLDPWQDLYNRISSSTMERLLQADAFRYRLSVNCRNTLPIGTEAALLSGTDVDSTLKADGPDVRHYWYRDDSDQRRAISTEINRLLSDGIQPRDIVILSPYRKENTCLRQGLLSVPFPVLELAGDFGARPSESIVFSTVTGFKGLEADVVLLIGLNSLAPGQALSIAYVGASRPRVLLEVFLFEGLRVHYSTLASSYGRKLASREERLESFDAW